MKLKDIAYAVLKEENRPLSVKDIMNFAREQGLTHQFISDRRASLAVMLYRDIRRRQNQSIFYKADSGRFGLRKWLDSSFDEFHALGASHAPSQKIQTAISRWYFSTQSVIAEFRPGNPYEQHCPIEHFQTILGAILEAFNYDEFITIPSIFAILDGRYLSPTRPFKKNPDDYKVRMTIGILVFEGFLDKNEQKKPTKYALKIEATKILDRFSEIM